eukprot:6054439-Amphidinium_carterae.1
MSKRSGSVTTDFHVQCVFLGRYVQGKFEEKLLHGRPVVVKHGKTSAALAAYSLVTPGLDLLQPSEDRVVIKHMVLDRGISRAVAEFLSGRWMAMASNFAGGSSDSDAEVSVSDLFEWHSHSGCAAHDLRSPRPARTPQIPKK